MGYFSHEFGHTLEQIEDFSEQLKQDGRLDDARKIIDRTQMMFFLRFTPIEGIKLEESFKGTELGPIIAEFRGKYQEVESTF